MTKEITGTKPSFDEDLSDDFLKNMIQETFDEAASLGVTGKAYSEPYDSEPVTSDSIGRNIEIVLNNTWLSFLQIQVKVNFLNISLLQYHQIAELSPERSYFSVLAVDKPKSVWIHHLNRSLAEGLASIILARSRKNVSGTYAEAVADGSLYLVIGPLINDSFRNICEKILKRKIKTKLEVRHLLSPGYHRWVRPEDRYAIMNFSLESPQLTGTLQVAIPRAVMMTLTDQD